MERMEKRIAASEKNLALIKIQSQQQMLGAANPFPFGIGMAPVQTASGQIQFTPANNFSAAANQMDLIFNRKVVKPIRGGAEGASGRSSNVRENSRGRPSLSNQLTFD